MKMLRSSIKKQKGVVFALFVVAMVTIIAVAGLALDVSHAYINKTQFQNALDAAALSGAMTLNQLGNDADAQDKAETDATATFNADLEKDLRGLTPTIEFSATIDPFTANTTPARFVRARVDNYSMSTWLLKVIGRDFLGVRASAVSGPMNVTPCNIGPFVVCGDIAKDCDEPEDCYGYKVDEPGGEDPQECYIKAAAPGNSDDKEIVGDQCGPEAGTVAEGGEQIGPGNFHFREYPQCSGGGGGGAKCMKEALGVGSSGQCLGSDDSITTQPGNITSIRKAFNTIFGIIPNGGQIDAADFPPDSVTDTGIFYDEYQDMGGNGRRVMPVVIADCETEDPAECTDHTSGGGKTCLPVLTVGCFFLTRPMAVPGDGGLGNTSIVWGEFVGECPSYGARTLDPNPVFDMEKIILYKDSGSKDS